MHTSVVVGTAWSSNCSCKQNPKSITWFISRFSVARGSYTLFSTYVSDGWAVDLEHKSFTSPICYASLELHAQFIEWKQILKSELHTTLIKLNSQAIKRFMHMRHGILPREWNKLVENKRWNSNKLGRSLELTNQTLTKSQKLNVALLYSYTAL